MTTRKTILKESEIRQTISDQFETRLSWSQNLPIILIIGIILFMSTVFLGAKNGYTGIQDIPCNTAALDCDKYSLRCQNGIVRHWTLDGDYTLENPRIIKYLINSTNHTVKTSDNQPETKLKNIENPIINAFNTWQQALNNMGVPMKFEKEPYDPDIHGNWEDWYKKNGYITIEWADIGAPGSEVSYFHKDINGNYTGYIKSSRIRLNNKNEFGDYYSNNKLFDLEGTVIHEIGHSLGLNDYDDPYAWNSSDVQTMQGCNAYSWDCRNLNTNNQCISKELRSLEKYDLQGLRHIYSQYSPNPNEGPSKMKLSAPADDSFDIDPYDENLVFEWDPNNTTICLEIPGIAPFGSGDPDCDKIRYKLVIREDGGLDSDGDDITVYDDYIGKQYEYSPETSILLKNLNVLSRLRCR